MLFPRVRRATRTITRAARFHRASVIAAAAAVVVGTPTHVTRSGHAKLSDGEILAIYIQVNSFDIETALLGRAQAAAPAVRQLAAEVSSDHRGVRDAAFSLATTCKVSPTLPNNRTAAAIEHGRALAALAALNGGEFDQAFMQHEVEFHRGAIDAVRTSLLPATTCPALRAHFTAVLPAMEHHLAETERLARQLAP